MGDPMRTKLTNVWDRDELREHSEDWNLELTDVERNHWKTDREPNISVGQDVTSPSEVASDLVARSLHLLYEGPGVVLLHGAPTESEKVAQSWLWSFCQSLGSPVPQSLDGALVGRVENLGADHKNPTHRGHKTSAGLPFHGDRTDVIALLCVRNAAKGGLSQIASVAKIYELLAAENAEALAVLMKPFPQDRRGEEGQGEPPWCAMPIFAFDGDRIVCRFIRRFIESSQRHADAPRLTNEQISALDLLDDVLKRPEVVLEMDLRPGQVQLIENHSILHARSAFDDGMQGGRLLLRLWVSTSRSPRLPDSFRPVFHSTDPGTVRGGVWPSGMGDRVIGETVRSFI